MNELLFNFEGKEVEVINFNGKALFNPYNVGECLDIVDSAVRKNIRDFNQNQVIKLTNKMISDFNLTGVRNLNNAGENFLTESGVYQLVMLSRKPSAQRFKNWITDEVLPRIRKYKAFIPGNTPEEIIENGTSAMDAMIAKYNDMTNYYTKENGELAEENVRLYLEKFSHMHGLYYGERDILRSLLNPNKFTSMAYEEFENLLINLGFIGKTFGGNYLLNTTKIKSIEPLQLTFIGLKEVCYAIDHQGGIYYHF